MKKQQDYMKTIQITGPHETRVIEKEMPLIEENEVLLKINYVGFCGSDLNTYLGRNPMVKLPVTPGHEISATIEATGSGVPAKFSIGQLVTVNPYTNCGTCASCRNRRVNACEHNETLGVQRDGAMTEYIAVPWQKVIPAGNLSAAEGALIEPMSVGFHAVARAQVTDIDTVMVIGCGMIGVGAIIRAALRGATVIAVDLDDEKLRLAKEIGVVIEAVGSAPTYLMAVNEVSFTGRIVYIGYAKSEIAFQTKLFVQKELDIRGSRNALPEDFRAVIHYLNRKECPTDKLISRIIRPEEAGEALKEWADNPGKVFRILVSFV